MRSSCLIGLLGLSFLLSGCVVRTYPLTRDRVDQDLTAGNRGYLQGTAPVPEQRKSTRGTRVFEIELYPLIKVDKKHKTTVSGPSEVEAVEDTSLEGNRGYMAESLTPEMSGSQESSFEKYTVQKGDTLQKISQKYFGTTKKWTKIYDANKDTLKGPNKIYVGQVLNIPVDSSSVTQPPVKLK